VVKEWKELAEEYGLIDKELRDGMINGSATSAGTGLSTRRNAFSEISQSSKWSLRFRRSRSNSIEHGRVDVFVLATWDNDSYVSSCHRPKLSSRRGVRDAIIA